MKSLNTPLRSAHSDKPKQSSYSELAAHYYDSALHPTCHALRAGSADLILQLGESLPMVDTIVELGAAKTILPEALPLHFKAADHVILVDSSKEMLNHSSPFAAPSVETLVSDAAETGLPDESVDMVVASLADPFNTSELWQEISRILRPGCVAIFTTPSWRWANEFRPRGQAAALDSSEFLTPDGEALAVPSYVLTEDNQRNLVERWGLKVCRVEGVAATDVPEADLAPKLAVVPRDASFATGYLMTKP